MVISRAIIRDLYPRERVGAMISLVVAVMMVAQMLSALAGGLLEIAFGWRAIFYAITIAAFGSVVLIAAALPETRRARVTSGGFRGDVGSLLKDRTFIGYMLCQVLASQIIFMSAVNGSSCLPPPHAASDSTDTSSSVRSMRASLPRQATQV